MLDAYAPLDGRFDEMVDDQGRVRPHWKNVAAALGALDARKQMECRVELRRLLQEHGVTYNIYGRKSKAPSPWALDYLPLVVSSREWREVEVGLAQRAEVLRHLIADIYGPQELIQRGVIPAALVFRHPGFLLPCWHTESLLQQALVIYAADLGRAPDGSFWVTADRTQAPSGVGYALEARAITSRVLPSLFREANVHPVLPFLRALRRSLTQLAAGEPDAIAVLTPGMANETYSEHAFLARNLGLPLVEGSDLQISRGRCWLLTADGRQPIRTVLRRLDDTFCDPLELNRQSVLGAPGLLQCVRNRSLNFANPLGSGVAENPGLMRYLPAVCRAVLGEDLKLRSVPTYWCGDADDRRRVRADFTQMVIRPLHHPGASGGVRVADLSAEQQAALRARVEAQPEAYAAHPAPLQGCGPVLTRQGVESRSVELRTFAVAEGDSFKVMSGGLARAGHTRENWRLSGQAGGISKDVWVLASEPQSDAQILPHYLPVRTRATLNEPHVADNLLWLARYLVRGELLARLLGHTLKRVIELGPQGLDAMGAALCRAVTWQTTLYPGFIGPDGVSPLANPAPGLHDAIHLPGSLSLAGVCLSAQLASGPLRHLLTTEISVNLVRLADDLAGDPGLEAQRRAVAQVELRLAAINGYLLRVMPQGGARQLIELGMAVETALGTIRLLRSLALDRALIDESGPLLLDLLNSTTTALEGLEPGSPLAVISAALMAESNPCSVRHQLMRIDNGVRSLPAAHSGDSRLEADVAQQLIALGSLELPSLVAMDDASLQLDRQLQTLDDWFRRLAVRLEQRYTPRRPAPSSQLVRTA
ncbi:MAG: circularly permuted type 2 ATP-grasp protein [Oceanococcaceae bacterium]